MLTTKKKLYYTTAIALLLFFSGWLSPCLAAAAAPKDTTSLNYYSFRTNETVNYHDFLANAHATIMDICEKGEVRLSAPDYGDKADYQWKGPHGYSIHGKELLLKNLFKEHSGVYTVTVSKGRVLSEAKILLKVHSRPEVKVLTKEFLPNEDIRLELESIDPSTRYTWKNQRGDVLSKLSTLDLPGSMPGEQTYFLEAEKEGCHLLQTVKIMVSDFPRGPKRSLNDMILDQG
ncbi:hypothetical protein [Jiulongibacter sp. NS-SX5]|uniref:hypothetical protein n=1 Tax=Jiulongibacter sp. NS-SX5 TaxID=3463854 RepID=UPI0040599184